MPDSRLRRHLTRITMVHLGHRDTCISIPFTNGIKSRIADDAARVHYPGRQTGPEKITPPSRVVIHILRSAGLEVSDQEHGSNPIVAVISCMHSKISSSITSSW